MSRNSKSTSIRANRAVFHCNQWWILLYTIPTAYIKRIAEPLKFPIGRNFNIIPTWNIISFLEEVHRSFIRTGYKMKFPCSVQGLEVRRLWFITLQCQFFSGVSHKISRRRQTIDMKHIKIFPIIIRTGVFVFTHFYIVCARFVSAPVYRSTVILGLCHTCQRQRYGNPCQYRTNFHHKYIF